MINPVKIKDDSSKKLIWILLSAGSIRKSKAVESTFPIPTLKLTSGRNADEDICYFFRNQKTSFLRSPEWAELNNKLICTCTYKLISRATLKL